MRTMMRAVLLATLVGCGPKLNLQVLQPAQVDSPPEVQSLIVVDRSRAKNFGQGVLGALEGALTGEAIGADDEGRSRAMAAVVARLNSSPRFQAAETWAPKREVESNLFDKELSWEAAERICDQAGCEGIIALEAFDSDSTVNLDSHVETEKVDGREVRRTVYDADRSTSVVTAWRYYDVVNRRILDDQRTWDHTSSWTGEGYTEARAIAQLPSQAVSVAEVGGLVGASYAERVAPVYVIVVRRWYAGGDDTLKEARDHVRAGDWPGAERLWVSLHEGQGDAKVRGKAAYNLALSAERIGDLERAREWAVEAAVLLANGRSRDYRATLDRRLADEALLQQQMRVTPKPAPGAPLAIPPK